MPINSPDRQTDKQLNMTLELSGGLSDKDDTVYPHTVPHDSSTGLQLLKQNQWLDQGPEDD